LACAAVAGIARADRWQRGWGATLAEQARDLPGDDLIPYPRLQATRAIAIAAQPRAVWPWLIQMGQDKGGFYSYDALENLVGLSIHSADAIVPEWQDLAVGDAVRLAPGMDLEVRLLDRPRALVLFADGPMPPATADDDAPTLRFSWSFVLDSEGPADSRLAIRERYSWDSGVTALKFWAIEWVSFAMTQRMLRGIRSRAEGRDGPSVEVPRAGVETNGQVL
jgi:hypothetical protein